MQILDNLGFFVFFFISEMVYCMYSLNCLGEAISSENIRYTYDSNENRKDIPILPPDLALWLKLISLNYPCLDHTFMVPKVLELLYADPYTVELQWLEHL